MSDAVEQRWSGEGLILPSHSAKMDNPALLKQKKLRTLLTTSLHSPGVFIPLDHMNNIFLARRCQVVSS